MDHRTRAAHAALAALLLVLPAFAGCGKDTSGTQPVATATAAAVVVTPLPTATPTPVPTEVPTPTPTPSPTPVPTPRGLLDWTYEDRFSFDGTVDTDTAYRDANISITLTSYEGKERTGKTLAYFVADVYVQDVTSIRRAQSHDDFEKSAMGIGALSTDNNAIIAMSGDYCTVKDDALVYVNGECVFDSEPAYDYELCALFRDGTMATFLPEDISRSELEARGVWQTWNFGPSLLDANGQPAETFLLPARIDGRNPRAAIGYIAPGHYCFVVVDGRQSGYSMGLDMNELATLMAELGCTVAYNLDGGISAQMTWHTKRVNQPGENRSIRDILYIAYPQTP